jgi:serpin B
MNLVSRFAVVALAGAMIAACSDPNSPGTARTIDALPRQLSAAELKLVAGNNTFAFELIRQINQSKPADNVFVSPLSASMALGMTANGAAGSTWDAMRTTLGLGTASRDEIGAGYQSLIALLRDLDKSTDFRIANSIWYEKTFPFEQTFLAESRTWFDADIQGLDFHDPASPGRINGWVSEATGKKIPEIVEDLSGDEVMYLINAIYFKGAWTNRFDRGKTENAPFHSLDGSTTQVPMMYQSGRMRLAADEDLQAVELLYGNSAFAMTIVLPRPNTDVNAALGSLTQSRWETLEKSFYEREGVLYLPRFRLTWERTLNDDLMALGMGVAFSEIEANFSRMSPERLMISKVLQKTFVEVNEEGTEAAAATSVGMVPVSAPPTIRVDRPFIVVIRERFSGTILFMGKITKLPA